MTVTTFGTLEDGTRVDRVTIAGGGLVVDLIGYGASIRDLVVDVGSGPKTRVLGLETLEHYTRHASHMGAIAGRYANRIGRGQFPLDGQTIDVTRNQAGIHHLHGGALGFGKRVWSLVDANASEASFQIVAEDGEEGYPGRVEVSCRYRISGDGRLTIELQGTTDAPTILNLATHSYFTLDGGADILDHRIEIPADAYTPVDEGSIPTGELAPVAGTVFDFRGSRPIRLMVDGARVGYDHNFVVARHRTNEPRLVARAVGPKSGTRLDVLSTEPGVQFYDAAKMNVPVVGTYGRRFGPCAGFCLEPQLFPDTPNKPQFGSAVLRPGETYQQVTEYRFTAV